MKEVRDIIKKNIIFLFFLFCKGARAVVVVSLFLLSSRPHKSGKSGSSRKPGFLRGDNQLPNRQQLDYRRLT